MATISKEESQLFANLEVAQRDKHINKTLSINEFMEDLSVRFKKEIKDITNVLVYYFPEHIYKSEYSSTKNFAGNITTTTKHYITLQPEMITLVNRNAKTQQQKFKSLSRNVYDIYRKFGIKFETNVHYHGKEDLIARFELKDSKINYLNISTDYRTWDATKKYDLQIKIFHIYDFANMLEHEESNVGKYLIKKYYKDAIDFEPQQLIDEVSTEDFTPSDDA